MENKNFIEAGRIVNTHGVQGEVKIEVWLDSAKFMKRFKRLSIDGKDFETESGREHKGFFSAKLKGIDDINAAMPLKGRKVLVYRGDAGLPEGRYFVQDILGARVQDEDGNEIGTLTDVMETPASLVYTVQGETEHLIPAVPEFIRNVDTENGIVTVRLIEGM